MNGGSKINSAFVRKLRVQLDKLLSIDKKLKTSDFGTNLSEVVSNLKSCAETNQFSSLKKFRNFNYFLRDEKLTDNELGMVWVLFKPDKKENQNHPLAVSIKVLDSNNRPLASALRKGDVDKANDLFAKLPFKKERRAITATLLAFLLGLTPLQKLSSEAGTDFTHADQFVKDLIIDVYKKGEKIEEEKYKKRYIDHYYLKNYFRPKKNFNVKNLKHVIAHDVTLLFYGAHLGKRKVGLTIEASILDSKTGKAKSILKIEEVGLDGFLQPDKAEKTTGIGGVTFPIKNEGKYISHYIFLGLAVLISSAAEKRKKFPFLEPVLKIIEKGGKIPHRSVTGLTSTVTGNFCQIKILSEKKVELNVWLITEKKGDAEGPVRLTVSATNPFGFMLDLKIDPNNIWGVTVNDYQESVVTQELTDVNSARMQLNAFLAGILYSIYKEVQKR